jgi:hypothetical protein
MVIATGTGEVYQDRFEQLASKFQPAEGSPDSYHPGRTEEKKEEPKLNIDRKHHVPLAAAGITDESGNMTGLAIDHRAPDPPDPKYFDFVHLHEDEEIKHMNNLMAAGAKPQEAYHESHDRIATPIESAAVRAHAARSGLDPDKYLDEYKQYWRDVASTAAEPTDIPRHPAAHTTVHGLDEAEGAFNAT